MCKYKGSEILNVKECVLLIMRVSIISFAVVVLSFVVGVSPPFWGGVGKF